MSTERRYGWMWLRALELADEAERLQRRFLGYIGPGTDAVHWEPPVDIHETADGIILLFAMPGVAAEDIANNRIIPSAVSWMSTGGSQCTASVPGPM